MNVVVTDANTPPALAVIRELGRLGHEVTAIAPESEKNTPIGLCSAYANSVKTFPSSLTESAYQDWLLDRLDNAKNIYKPVLFPTGKRTLRLVAKRKIEFRLASEFLVPDTNALMMSFDKRQLYKAADLCGIATPTNIHIPDGVNLRKVAEDFDFPLILKYWGGEKLGLSAKRRYTISNNAYDFAKRYNNMYDVQSPVLVQPKLQGNCYGVTVCMNSLQQPVRIIIHERIRQLPITGGMGTLIRSTWRKDIAQAAVKLLKHLKWEGIAMLEFIATENDFTLLDLNARLCSSYTLGTHCNGRISEAYVLAANGAELASGVECRYQQNVKMQYFIDDLQSSILTGPKTFFNCMKSLSDSKVKGGVRAKDDKKPMKAYVRSIIKKPIPEPW